ncbi:hypothetical protein KQH82_10780 [bacterium]|nr:hypothetical protein [bacterium]
MQTRIASTSAPEPLGDAPGANLLEITSGARAGRRVAVFLTDSHTLACSWADRPYANWSTPEVVSSAVSGADGFVACLDSENNLHVACIAQSTLDVMHCRLAFDGSEWVAGSPVTVFTGEVNSLPSLTIDAADTLWLGWVRLTDPPVRHIHVKSSQDGGASWGSGSTDPGEEIHSGGMVASVKLLAGPDRLHAVYYYANDFLCHRARTAVSGVWTDPVTIASGTECSGRFDCVLRSDGNLSVAWAADSIYYREYDGVSWGSIATIPETGAEGIQLLFANGEPIVGFVRAVDGAHRQACFVRRQGGEFGECELLDPRVGDFNTVLCYHGPSATFADVTAAAQSAQSGDVVHPSSGALLASSGDALFVGASLPFRYLWLQLSVAGAGGTVSFSYWDGAVWRGFSPQDGSALLDATDIELWLWSDYASIPSDWQKCAVNGASLFWLKIEVVSPFTTPPVGTRLTGVSGISAIRVGR